MRYFLGMGTFRRLFTPALCGLLGLGLCACENSDPPGESTGASSKPADSGTTGGNGDSSGGSGDTGSGDTTTTGPADPAIPGLEERKSTLPRATPQVAEQDKVALRDGNRDLSFELLRNTGKDAKENVAVSAISMRAAFGMVHAMAKGETQSEIATAMQLLDDPAKAQAGINHIDQTLMSRNLPKSEYEAPVIMSTGNRMFVRKGMTPSSEFLDTLAQNYGAGIYETDFEGDSQGARKAINGWVAKKTFDKIPELLPASAVNPTTTWVLTNAMYFKAPWSVEMRTVGDKEFTLADGKKVSAPSIFSNDIRASYGNQPGFEWAQLPLRGGNLSALLILPDVDKYAEVEAKMSAQVIEKMIAEKKSGDIEITMPKFKIETGSMEFTNYLETKMPKAFGEADFGGFGGNASPTPITFVFHSVFLAADENGVEAAAATGVGSDESAPNPEYALNVDRPFMFLVYDEPSGLILFTGRVMDPTV